jgi:hypothetical protein
VKCDQVYDVNITFNDGDDDDNDIDDDDIDDDNNNNSREDKRKMAREKDAWRGST